MREYGDVAVRVIVSEVKVSKAGLGQAPTLVFVLENSPCSGISSIVRVDLSGAVSPEPLLGLIPKGIVRLSPFMNSF
jgi:hypothetical protein